jgi:DNA-directed RNA polymerase subunit RPC12/RpoP
MLRFRCSHCAQKLRVQDHRAGRIARCPRCKERIAIPSPSASESAPLGLEDELTLVTPPKPLDGLALDLDERRHVIEEPARPRRSDEELLASLGATSPPARTGERVLPWPIDVFLYPVNVHGLIALAIIAGIPTGLSLLCQLVPLLGFVLGLPLLILTVILWIYTGWYLAECVHDSARGGTRAPEISMGGVGFGDMWSRVIYLAATYALFGSPVFFYYVFTQRADPVFWALFAWAVVFFPIGLLAMVINDSTSALNPLFLLGSIGRAFIPYVGLLLLLVPLLGLLALLDHVLTGYGPAFLRHVLGRVFTLYAALVLAHVFGRFYWHNRERLDWGI